MTHPSFDAVHKLLVLLCDLRDSPLDCLRQLRPSIDAHLRVGRRVMG